MRHPILGAVFALVFAAPVSAQEAGPAALCLSAAGVPDAGVPVSAEVAAAARDGLRAAAEACATAAEAPDAAPEVLYQAAMAAQMRGDNAGAFALMSRAAEAGLGAAHTRLGDFYTFGLAPGGKDPAKAVAEYEAAATAGDAAGMTTLAILYRLGHGVPRDPARMVALLTEAADAGYHFAAWRLGQVFLTGDGIPGGADAALGIPDPAAAEAGNIEAALELANLYGDPRAGLPDDPAAQARLTSLASRSGEPAAVAAMGLLYEQGRGVARDPGVAAGLYVKALESGKVSFDQLRRGAGGWDRDTAIAFQKILQERGLYSGALDGIVGPGTAAAARGLAR